MSLREALLARFPALAGLDRGSFVVGGAVRDLLLEREPADVDVACPDPLAAARSVGRAIRLGDQRHLSAWRVVTHQHVYDFAAIEGGSIERDLTRRDFTVNAMAVDLADGTLHDPFGGREDLGRRVVRMVDPTNFDDDPLRVLKGVRMAVCLGFDIEAATMREMALRGGRITGIAAERVMYELSVVFSAGALRRACRLLAEAGLSAPLALDVRAFHFDDVSLAGSFAVLVREPRAHSRRWRWSTDLQRHVLALQSLVERHDRLALYDAGEAVSAQLPGVLRALGRPAGLDLPDFSIHAFLSGDEIAKLRGIEPGPELGAVKRALLEAQVRGEVRTREDAEAFVAARG